MENLPNDFIYNSAVVWEHRNSGDYNDLIMRTLNEMVLLTDEDSSD